MAFATRRLGQKVGVGPGQSQVNLARQLARKNGGVARGLHPVLRSKAAAAVDRFTQDGLILPDPVAAAEEVVMADAMFAPVATRFITHVVAADDVCTGYRDAIMAMAPVQERVAQVLTEPDGIDELEAEF